MIVSYIRSILLTPLSSEVSTRIYPITLPLDEPLPALVLQEISHKQYYSLDRYSRVQVSILAQSTDTEHGYDTAHRIRDKVLAVLNNHTGTDNTYRVQDIRHIGDTETIVDDSFAIYSDYEVIWTQ